MVTMSAPMVHFNNQKLATMTTLNSQLQLAFLNRKKGRNLLEKGFTLVELMIVIVIVGFSALHSKLPEPKSKGESSRRNTKISAALKSAGAEWHSGSVTCTDFQPVDTTEWTFGTGSTCDDTEISYTGTHADVGTITGTLVPTTGVTNFATAAP